MNMLAHQEKRKFYWFKVFATTCVLGFLSIYSCGTETNTPSTSNPGGVVEEEELDVIDLNLRIHLMQDINMIHATGVEMYSWVTADNIEESVLPELNAIWDQSKINWKLESVVKEDVVKNQSYDESIEFLVTTDRDSNGSADPARLPILYDMMQPEHRSTADELGTNLFHIYIFPFIGNTSQGHAMPNFGFHCVVSSWTNKHNNGGAPEKTLLTEHQNVFNRGSLSRTIAHELGHVLRLFHNECNTECLMGGNFSNGYFLTDEQIATSRAEALLRSS